MPAHNARAYISEAIDSILKQTYKNIELIVVDDASTDSTHDILSIYQKKHPNIMRVITNKKSLGKSGDPATNLAIKKAKGAYIAKMDADDIAHPKRIEKQVKFLQDNKNIFMCGTQAYVIDREGNILGKKELPLNHKEIYESFFQYNNIIHPSIMFRKIPKSKNFYSINYDHFNEYYTFFKFMSEGRSLANLQEHLMYYRVHGENDTFRNVKTKFRSTLRIRLAFVKDFGYIPTFSQIFYTLLQTMVVFSMPEKVITFIYLVSRKVITGKSIKRSFQKIKSGRSYRLAKISTQYLTLALVFLFTLIVGNNKH